MKPRIVLLCLPFVLILAACAPATPTPAPTAAGQLETQIAATILAEQAAAAATQQAKSLTLTAAVPTPTSTPPVAPTTNIFNIRIEASACWVNTGLTLTTGQTVTIDASGTANTWEGKDISNGGPDGQPANQCGAIECPHRGSQYGALIGRIGEGETFLVGSHLVLTVTEDGELFLTINDWECDDNLGGFNASITID